MIVGHKWRYPPKMTHDHGSPPRDGARRRRKDQVSEFIGTGLIEAAAAHACTAGCEWLHVDFEDHLSGFYFQACGFRPTMAGLIALTGDAGLAPGD